MWTYNVIIITIKPLPLPTFTLEQTATHCVIIRGK